jgi:hypothetical protein
MSNNEWNNLYNRVRKMWEDTKDEELKKSTTKYFLDKKLSDDFKSNYGLSSKLGWRELIKDDFSQKGIACFSEKVDSVLMWSHYSDHHRGYCLEFDTGFYPFSKAEQVHYSETLPSSLQLDGDAILLDPLVTTKSKGWSYEKEWRLIHEHGNIEYGFDARALTGVYFGCEMPFVHIEIIALAVSGFPTKLYRMKRSETEFKVDFEEVEYTPYVYSKSKRRFLG